MAKDWTDLKIHGTGSSSGGKYKTISIMGEGKIEGDVDCIDIKVYGEGKIKGQLKAEETIDIKGHAAIKGNLEGETLKLQGDIQFCGASVEKAEIMGNINAENDFNAEDFKLEGGFKIGGLLNADKIEINLYWPCKALEIGGSEIKVKKETRLNFLGLKNLFMPNGSSKELTVNVVEGDDVCLEYTQAKIVRGNNVELGPGCDIEFVEYKNDFKKDDESKVGDLQKV